MGFHDLNDDTLIHICSYLPAQSVLSLRQTCKRLAEVSKLRFVWQNVYHHEVLLTGYPFPHERIASADACELERLVLHSLRVGAFWLDRTRAPSRVTEFQASSGTALSHISFLPGHGGRYVLTVYMGIWSMITCWDIGPAPSNGPSPSPPRRVANWSPSRTIFSGFVVNSDPDSEAALAVAIQHAGSQSIEILSVFDREGTGSSFRSVCNVATTFRPIALKGDVIAFSDDGSDTVIMNWRENTFALLKGSERLVDENFKFNRCLQVMFTYKSILVVRARSVELFPDPVLLPATSEYATYRSIGAHSFGWIDGVAVNTQNAPLSQAPGSPLSSPLSIVLRAESDDPWVDAAHKLEQFILAPNPSFDPSLPSSPPESSPSADLQSDLHTNIPYLFPPTRAEHTPPTMRGFLRCRAIALGRAGTALWIQPRAARAAHLTGFDVHASVTQVSDGLDPDAGGARGAETLCAAVFDGPLRRSHPELGRGEGGGGGEGEEGGEVPRARTVWVQSREGCSWTAFDYDEEAGRVALGSSNGSVTVLDLA